MKTEPEKKILHLTLHRKWFEDIWSGKKKEEYRDRKAFWSKRLFKDAKPIQFDYIHFRNGYHKNAPTMLVEYLGIVEKDWRGNPVYAIQLGAIIETTNYPGPKNAAV